MNKRIVVTSNCQTAGLAASLELIFPNCVVVPVPLNYLDGPDSANYRDIIKSADFWLSSGRFDILEDPTKSPKLIVVPIIYFDAFQPDITYVLKDKDSAPIEPHYNSLIGIWSYVNNIQLKDSVRMFNLAVFKRLGYLDRWKESVTKLRSDFETCGLDFARFFLHIKRLGIFMHSVNHPRIEVLVILAKMLSEKICETKSNFESELIVPETLNYPNWPVYPEIADSYATTGSYSWSFSKTSHYHSLISFLEFSNSVYDSYGLRKEHIVLSKPIDYYDLLLTSFATASA
jgi:hypothetical protein